MDGDGAKWIVIEPMWSNSEPNLAGQVRSPFPSFSANYCRWVLGICRGLWQHLSKAISMHQGSWEQLAGERALASHTLCILMFLDLETAWVNLLWQWKHLCCALKVSERWVLFWQPGVLHSSTFHPTKNCQRAACWTTNAIIAIMVES